MMKCILEGHEIAVITENSNLAYEDSHNLGQEFVDYINNYIVSPKLKKGVFTIALSQNLFRKVEGYEIVGTDLFVHKVDTPYVYKKPSWTISHIPTGVRVSLYSDKTRNNAIANSVGFIYKLECMKKENDEYLIIRKKLLKKALAENSDKILPIRGEGRGN